MSLSSAARSHLFYMMMIHNLASNIVHLLLLLTNFLVFFQIPSKAGDAILLHTCFNSTNYTSGSKFQTNLNHLFTLLYTNAPLNGFNATISGQDPDRVYGLVQCIGDYWEEDCHKCVNTSSIKIVQLCPNRKEGAIRYGQCALRYSYKLFFGTAEHSLKGYSTYVGKNVSDPINFNHQLGVLMKNLSSKVVYGQSKFAKGMIGLTDFQNIYALLQCTQDLSDSYCNTCLMDIIGDIQTFCGGKPGGSIFTVSCFLRLEEFRFYRIFPPPPSIDATPPNLPASSVQANTTRTDGAWNNLRIVAIVVLPLQTALLLVLSIYISLLRRKTRKKCDVEDLDITSEDSFLMDLNKLKIATEIFSNANKLGEGGFGPVYKGKLLDGCEIAVKRLSRSSMQGLEELKTEVDLVAKLQHRNLVRLLGYCLEEQEKLLVYEYLPNSSLNSPPHSVLEVTKADYDSCQTGNPLQIHSDGTTVILLSSPTKRYFICGIPGHCAQGMKLQVEIMASSTPPPTSPVNAPPPPSLSSPPPSAPPPTPPPTSPVKLPPSSTTSPPPLTIPPPKSPSSQTVSPSKSPSPSSVPSISPLSSGTITSPSTKPLLMAPSTSPSSSTPPQPSPSSANKEHLEFKLVTGLGLGMIILLAA